MMWLSTKMYIGLSGFVFALAGPVCCRADKTKTPASVIKEVKDLSKNLEKTQKRLENITAQLSKIVPTTPPPPVPVIQKDIFTFYLDRLSTHCRTKIQTFFQGGEKLLDCFLNLALGPAASVDVAFLILGALLGFLCIFLGRPLISRKLKTIALTHADNTRLLFPMRVILLFLAPLFFYAILEWCLPYIERLFVKKPHISWASIPLTMYIF